MNISNRLEVQMFDIDLFQFYKQIKDQNILLSFKGTLSQEILVEMGTFIKEQFSVDKKLKKIFSVFVELAQNIMHYSAERAVRKNKDIGKGIILFTEAKDFYTIYSGNQVKNDNINDIQNQLDTINDADLDTIKQMYTEQMRKPREDGQKGAGLGFLDIARNGRINTQIGEELFHSLLR